VDRFGSLRNGAAKSTVRPRLISWPVPSKGSSGSGTLYPAGRVFQTFRALRVPSQPLIFEGLEKVPIHDADGNHAYDAIPPEARALIDERLGRPFGQGRRAIGVILLVALDKARPTHMQRAMSLEAYGKRYVYEEHLGDRWYVYAFCDFDQAGRNCLLSGGDFLQVPQSTGARLIRRTVRLHKDFRDPSVARHRNSRRLVPPLLADPSAGSTTANR